MQLNYEKIIALFSSILLTLTMVLAVRAGFPTAKIPTATGLQQLARSKPTTARGGKVSHHHVVSEGLMRDRAGAGLETGMPYYSFATRSRTF